MKLSTGLTSRLPDATLLMVAVVWGASFFVTQVGLRDSGPFAFLGIRFALATVFLMLLTKPNMRQLTRWEIKAGLAIGLALFIGFALQTVGLQFIDSSRSAFITTLYVPIVPLLQMVFLHVFPSTPAWVGIGLAFMGMVLISAPSGQSLELGVGEWLTIASTVVIAAEIILIGYFAKHADPKRLAVIQVLVVTVLSFICMPFAGEGMPNMSGSLWACVLSLGIATAFMQVAMNWAQKTVSPARAAIIYATEPVWAGFVGWWANEPLTWLSISGAGLIILGVVISEWRSHEA